MTYPLQRKNLAIVADLNNGWFLEPIQSVDYKNNYAYQLNMTMLKTEGDVSVKCGRRVTQKDLADRNWNHLMAILR